MLNTTRETVLDKFTGCELVFTAGKNAALACLDFSENLNAVGSEQSLTDQKTIIFRTANGND